MEQYDNMKIIYYMQSLKIIPINNYYKIIKI